jgi:hypothetical protein
MIEAMWARVCRGDKAGPSGLSSSWSPRVLLQGGVRARRVSSAGYWSLRVAVRQVGNKVFQALRPGQARSWTLGYEPGVMRDLGIRIPDEGLNPLSVS